MGYDVVVGMTERSSERARLLIARRGAESVEVLVLRLPHGRTALPVFGLGEKAGLFLWLEVAEEGWRVTETSEGDLATLLRGSCAGVRWIIQPFAADGVGRGPAIVAREDFLRAPSGEQSCRVGKTEHELPPLNPSREGEDYW